MCCAVVFAACMNYFFFIDTFSTTDKNIGVSTFQNPAWWHVFSNLIKVIFCLNIKIPLCSCVLCHWATWERNAMIAGHVLKCSLQYRNSTILLHHMKENSLCPSRCMFLFIDLSCACSLIIVAQALHCSLP